MKRLLLGLVAMCIAMSMQATTVNYTADNSTIFSNPERGFITMLTGHLTKSKPYAVKGNESTLDEKKSSEKMSIVLVHYYLDNFKSTTTLPSEVLNGFDADMQVLRNKGMKAIIRFSYVDGTYEKKSGEESAQDAAWSIVKQHIDQYKSHWQANADVIFCFQAGIVGAWGEWYYSDNYGNQTGHINAARREVIDTLLSAVPADRMIQLRTPLFKTEYMGDTKALSAEEAFTGTPRARLGHHNDAFLYDYDNMGTYTDTAKQKPWLAQETLYVPIGGETDITDLGLAQEWATYDKTIAEMSRLHWTFISSGYAETTTNMWRNNGTFDELNRRMGYRYQLVSGTYSDQVAQGGQLSVNMQIRNVGFAPLYNARTAYIVLKNGSKTYSLALQSDPRRWLPNGVVTTVNEQLNLPGSIPAGTYQLYLYMPDAYESIADNPAYAVRFANSNIWESSTGMNKLNASVTVTSGSTPVDPPQPEGDAVVLPATLNKANVDSYSSDMTWYQGDFFDFGPADNPNLDRWAEWKVELRYPGRYNLSDVATGPDAGAGHSWKIELLSGSAVMAECATDSVWTQGPSNYKTQLDLSGVVKGTYVLRVTNAFKWAQPKLQSLTLAYDGDLPSDIESVMDINAEKVDNQAFDLLGRPVDEHYEGIVIQGGRKSLRVK